MQSAINGSVIGSNPIRPVWLCTQAATRRDCKSLVLDFGGSSPSATTSHFSTEVVRHICNVNVVSSNLTSGFHGLVV